MKGVRNPMRPRGGFGSMRGYEGELPENGAPGESTATDQGNDYGMNRFAELNAGNIAPMMAQNRANMQERRQKNAFGRLDPFEQASITTPQVPYTAMGQTVTPQPMTADAYNYLRTYGGPPQSTAVPFSQRLQSARGLMDAEGNITDRRGLLAALLGR